jgi:hypothetical protein
MGNPVSDIESGSSCGEVSVVECQKELIVVADTLHSMRHALREVPDVSFFDYLVLVAALLIDNGDAERSFVEVAPFGLSFVSQCILIQWNEDETHYTVPMELTNATFLDVLLGAGDILAGRQVRDDLLPRPATSEDVRLGIGHAPLEIDDIATIRRLLAEIVRVVEINLVVGYALLRQTTVEASAVTKKYLRLGHLSLLDYQVHHLRKCRCRQSQ